MRKKTPKLAFLKGHKLGTVVEAFKEKYSTRWRSFVKSTDSLIKDAIKAQLRDDELASVGLKLQGGEEFFVEPNQSKVREVAKAAVA